MNIEYVNQFNDGKDPKCDGSNYSGFRSWVMKATTGVVVPSAEPPHPNFAPRLCLQSELPEENFFPSNIHCLFESIGLSLTIVAHCMITYGI